MRLYWVAHFFLLGGSSSSLDLGFCQLLSNRKILDILALWSSSGDFSIFSGRRDICIWFPNPSKGRMCRSFFYYLVTPSPFRRPIFSLPWKVKITKKVKFLVWQVLHGRINTLDQIMVRLSFFIGSLCCILCKIAMEVLNHLLWSCDYAMTVWTCLFQSLCISVAQARVCSFMIELLLHPPKQKGSVFVNSWHLCFVMGLCGWRNNSF